MAAYSTQYYTNDVSLPTKDTDASYTYPYGYNNTAYDVSPAETTDPSVVSSGGATYSYNGTSSGAGGSSALASNYHHQGSQAGGDDCYYYGEDSVASASGVDFNEYMQDRFANAFDPLPLDRSLVTQAQT